MGGIGRASAATFARSADSTEDAGEACRQKATIASRTPRIRLRFRDNVTAASTLHRKRLMRLGGMSRF
jgi:hypothetical protein